MIRALIFDFDGLILETETPEYQAWQEIYCTYGFDLPLSTWAECIGVGREADVFSPYKHLEAQVGRALDHTELRTQHRRRSAELLEMEEVLPGIEEYIATAKRLGLKLGVASSSSYRWVVGHLTRLNLKDCFDCIVCADDVTYTKPDPELYFTALDRLGVQANEALAFEDSPNGARAAKRAGIFCITVPGPLTSQLPFDEVDMQLTSLADMPLERLLRLIDKATA